MEEQVGLWIHRWLGRLAPGEHADAAASLPDSAALWFRAFGGNPALALARGADTRSAHLRGLRQRLAGSGTRAALAWVDDQAVHLPPRLARYADAALNRDLYFWLVALAATSQKYDRLPWFTRNQAATHDLLRDWPGLRPRHARLVDAELACRPAPRSLPADQAAQEQAIRQALRHPGSVPALPPARRPWHPVAPWLRPDDPEGAPARGAPASPRSPGTPPPAGQALRRRATRVPAPRGPGGLYLPRPESMRGLAQYTPMDLQAQDDDSPPSPQAADELDNVHVTRDERACASRVHMDVEPDTPAGDADPARGPELLPEWDWRAGVLRPARCALHRDALPVVPGNHAFPERLDAQRKRLRRMFAALTPGRERLRAQPEGHDIDVDRYLRQRLQGETPERVFLDTRERRRDLSCLLLADLSLSTDAAVSDGRQVIDVIRDGLLLFAETLHGVGDRFAIHGFHSQGRHRVRLHDIKTFDQPYGTSTRARIAAATPAGYTRMGAAIRAATRMLQGEPARQRLLLLLSDGKPNDADAYEGRYGIEDTRHAFLQARRQGLHPFCVTIDQQAQAYLPHVFGRHHFAIVRHAAELPQRLTMLYARLRR